MKRFISTIPIQPEGSLHKTNYLLMEDNALLKTDRTTRFPILIPLENSVSEGEKIIVTVILIDRPNVPRNYELFKEELKELSQLKKFTYEIVEVRTPDSEIAKNHLDLFKNISTLFANNRDEELYACITYGTKPMPMLLMMALTFAYKLCDSFTIESIVYGGFEHSLNQSFIYDVSSMFYLNSAVNNMANLDIEDPLKIIDGFIS
ncbi:MAG: TM1812 family CRISPR-associated protein [Ruminococcus sp.]|nr:TM1812 family CRISPR-associated protein [Ruminococcus sp.]